MTFLEVVALLRRIDLSSGPINELFVPEIVSQVIAVGIQQARVAELRQCHDVRIIGPTDAGLSEVCCPLFDFRIVDTSRSPLKQRLLQPEPERLGCGKFPAQLTADDQLTSSRINPPAERHAGRGPVSSEHLMRDVIVKDGAHDYRPIDRLVSSMKNRR